MPRKKKEKDSEFSVEKTSLIFAFFIVFVLVFLSLGGERSFRDKASNQEVAGETDSYREQIERNNNAFIAENMPYFKNL